MAQEPKKIGLLVGREWSWPPAFIEEVNNRDQGVIAEYVTLAGTKMDEPTGYAVIIDRISHEIPYYRSYLKNAVLQGTHVINNPFMWTSDDKFFDASLATKLGVASPKTIVLPNKEYVEGIVDESLRNLAYPLDWDAIAQYIGMPAILKDAHGGGWKEVYKVNSVEELIWRYNESGRLTMIVQEFIEWDHYVRCMCLNREWVLAMKYDPKERRYHVEHAHMSPELGARVVNDALALCRALGYDMNTVEFAIRDGVPYAIDFMNPAPDMDIYSLTPHYFQWAVERMADMCIQKALSPVDPRQEYRWYQYVAGGAAQPTPTADSNGRTPAPQAEPVAAQATPSAGGAAMSEAAVTEAPKKDSAKKSSSSKSSAKGKTTPTAEASSEADDQSTKSSSKKPAAKKPKTEE